MTLIITSISKDRVVQVSDRRLTTPMGDIYDDSANKAIAVGMGYVHFVASYTGLAYIGHLTDENRTDRWLQYHLGSITSSGERDSKSSWRALIVRTVRFELLCRTSGLAATMCSTLGIASCGTYGGTILGILRSEERRVGKE